MLNARSADRRPCPGSIGALVLLVAPGCVGSLLVEDNQFDRGARSDLSRVYEMARSARRPARVPSA